MAIDEGLARVSLELVYGSLAVYSLAMVSYAVAAAQAIRPGEDTAETEAVSVGEPAYAGASTAMDLSAEGPLGRVSRMGASAPAPAATGPMPWRRAAGIGTSLTVLANVLLLAGIVTRGVAAGRRRGATCTSSASWGRSSSGWPSSRWR